MKSINLSSITKNGRALYLAYDQGIEHGPEDFNDNNVDPLYIIDIAKKGKFNGVVFQKGIAEKYYNEIKKSKVPLIVKLNGKTGNNLYQPAAENLLPCCGGNYQSDEREHPPQQCQRHRGRNHRRLVPRVEKQRGGGK